MAAIDLLIDNLRQTHQLYAELVELGERKKEAIIQNQMNDLSQLVSRETRLLKQISELDHERQLNLSACLAELGFNSSQGMNLEDLIRGTMNLEYKRQLQQLRDSILREADELKRLNAANQMLVQHALDFVNLSLDMVAGGPEDDMIYQAPAQQPAVTAGRKRFFDTRA